MKSYNDLCARLEPMKQAPNCCRILAELQYLSVLSAGKDGAADREIDEACLTLCGALDETGALTAADVARAEDILAPAKPLAKSLTTLYVANSHIDMNWMWRWDETVQTTLDTLRTMLSLMDEYPDFRYSQSQAAVYRIVEQYDPEMLAEIRRRVKEGRWEVTASTWVEADKNLAGGESMARQILYAKRALSRLLDIDMDAVTIDFEPDTFGHSAQVPEVLAGAGIRYYYHARGRSYEDDNLCRWRAPSGAEVIAHKEQLWYNCMVEPVFGVNTAQYCLRYGRDLHLVAYGVGDHGGGPTRRDIHLIHEMMTWPIYPAVRIGTFAEYFAALEPIRETLPVVEGELNFVFDGCYTTQSRIKEGNRRAERALARAEQAAVLAGAATGGVRRPPLVEEGWRGVLLNQFHDILPGSGTIDTREHAMAQYQEAYAVAGTMQSRAQAAAAARVNTAPGGGSRVSATDMAMGGGPGMGAGEGGSGVCARGEGDARAYVVFNPSPYPRTATAELLLWDYERDDENVELIAEDGESLPVQLIQRNGYWAHTYARLLTRLDLPAGGYRTVYLKEKETSVFRPLTVQGLKTQEPAAFSLENEYLKAVFCPRTGVLESLLDKTTGAELAGPGGGRFQLVAEEGNSMSAWTIARDGAARDIQEHTACLRRESGPDSAVRQSMSLEIPFGSSVLKMTISLDRGERFLRFDGTADFRETGTKERIPRLVYTFSPAYEASSFRQNIPFGFLRREAMNLDVPTLGFCGAQGGAPAMAWMMAENKYGYRCVDNRMTLSLIRGAENPDILSDFGPAGLRFCLGAGDPAASDGELTRLAFDIENPPAAAHTGFHEGDLPERAAWFEVDCPQLAVTALKCAEDGESVVLRLYETDGRPARGRIRLPLPARSVELVNLQETAVMPGNAGVEEGTVWIEAAPFAIVTARIQL